MASKNRSLLETLIESIDLTNLSKTVTETMYLKRVLWRIKSTGKARHPVFPRISQEF